MSSNPKIDYITFSGSGEPTLNNKIGDVINFIKKNYPEIKTAVLTNGTLLFDKKLRTELLQTDVILPSLDAASQDTFEKIDRSNSNLKIENYIQGLIDLRTEYKGKIWLEIFLLKSYNDSKEELNLIKETKKWHYTHKRIRSAYRSLKTNLPYLFTWYDYIDLNIPNTTNSLEGTFSDLKNKIRVHAGLKKQRKMKLINELLNK